MQQDLQTRRSAPWVAAVVVLLTLLLVAVGVLARSPTTRRRVRRRAEQAWVGVEDLAERQARRLGRRQRRLEAGARRVLDQLWELVDDLPFVPDRDPIPRVSRRLYAHGAFMGAGPLLLDDPRWRAILGFLMPDVFHDVREAVRTGVRVGGLIPMFENNPVVAAYGVWRCGLQGELDAMEWDVYLDGHRVEAWEEATDAPTRDALLDEIVASMVIAHASTTDTVQEHIGLCQWADVRRTPKSRLGGVEPAAWMDLFGRALYLAGAADLRVAIDEMRAEDRDDSDLACRRHTFASPWSSDRVAALFRAVSGRPRFGVVLEIKSLRSTPELLGAIVRALNRRHIEVVAVGSFLQSEVRGLAAMGQLVDGVSLPGPREVVFLHFAADLQQACDRGTLDRGSAVLFNGACLLRALPGAAGRYAVDDAVVAGLEEYRRAFDLRIGLYVQEYDCDAAAAGLLSDLARERSETFALGFAWGGLADEVALMRGRGDHRGFGAQWALQRVSRGWTPRPRPA